MATPDPAERRAVIRGAIECAIALNPTVRPRQAAPLVVSVWRIVEPALAQRDRQITAVRDVIDAMDNTSGARFWAQQLHAALGTRPGAGRPPIAWCGASMPGYGAAPIGPCVLRHGHDGPVHQTADGAKWWPTDAGPVPGVRPLAEIMQLDASSIDPAATHPEPPNGAAIWEAVVRLYSGLSPCESGRHDAHPDRDCDEQDALVKAWQKIFTDATIRWADPPRNPGALAPLRDLAARALAEEQPAVIDARPPFHPGDFLPGYPTEADFDAAPPPQFTGVIAHIGVSPDQCRAEFHHPTMQSARCDLATGHPDYHREQPDPDRAAFRWDDSVAMYPTTTEG